MRRISKILKKILQLSRANKKDKPAPIVYRVTELEKDEEENHVAVIQIIGKDLTFKAKPEKILSDDKLINHFSQRDIRNLTYLGYLNTNSPKYKVLSKRHVKNIDKIVFSIHKKGENKAIVKTASQISTDEEILDSLSQKDAHMIGYVSATELTLQESKEKKKLKEELLTKID